MKGKTRAVLLVGLALSLLASTSGVTGTSFTTQEGSLDNVLRGWMPGTWVQTTQADFETGVLNNVGTTSPGNVELGAQSFPTNIASEDFESGGWNGGSGWLWGWWYSGDADVVTTANPHGGSYHLRLRGSSGYVDRAVDLSGQTNVRLQFWGKASTFEAGETAACLVSSDGVDWTMVQTWAVGDDDNVYHFYDIDLSGFTMSSEFYIAFDADMSGADDALYIDDLILLSVYYEYYSSGTIASQVLDTGELGTSWDELNWSETLQSGTDITFEVRASDTSFAKDDVAPSWGTVGGTSPITTGLPSGRYMQWRATLTTWDPANTPTLHDVTVVYTTSSSNMWLQTTKADFEAGVPNNADSATWPGDVLLGLESYRVYIASDNFENGGWSGGSGWLWGWWYSGDASVSMTGSPHGGSYHLRLRGATGYVDRALDLSGQTEVWLQFWAKANSFEAGDTATCLVSYNGTDWTVVQTWADGDDDNTYHFYDIDLSGFTMSSEFYIAFDAEMSATNDQLYIDDLALVTSGSQYYSSGTIASQVFDTGVDGTTWNELSWSGTLQSGTDINFEVRASDTLFTKEAASPSWVAVGGSFPVTSGLPSGRYLQWRANLSTSDPANTSTLHDVTVYYN